MVNSTTGGAGLARQSGAVLIVALVLLLIATMLGVAVMQGATLETRMAASSQQRQQAFNAAETALRQAEKLIETSGFADSKLRDNCTGTDCFNAACNGGRCFSGEFDASAVQNLCKTTPATGPTVAQVWNDPALDVWNTAGKHVVVNIPAYDNAVVPAPGKYIIEFRCFTDGEPNPAGGTGLVSSNTGDVMYRITARGASRNGKVEAMVQGTYRAPAP